MRAALLILVASCKFHGMDLPDGDAPIAMELPGPPPDMAQPTGDWTQVALGTQHACAIKLDGRLYCWGYNYWNVLGSGTTQSPFQQLAPLQVGTDTWKQVAAGTFQTCAIKSDDTLWCWGTSVAGVLGLGATTAALAPTQITAPAKWKAISASSSHTCGIDADDHRWCWGDGTYGELGDGLSGTAQIPVTQTSPKQIGTDTWLVLRTGYLTTCGIKSDGTLWCNGVDNIGQLGDNDGTGTTKPLPTKIGATAWADVNLRYAHTCALAMDHSLWCWGFGALGTIGDDTTMTRLQPTMVGSTTDWTTFGVGRGATCGTHADGRVECWGNDTYGETGFGDHATISMSPRMVDVGGVATGFALGDLNACAITQKHALVCTGQAAYGQLANGVGMATAPQQVPGEWTRVSAGQSFTCGHTGDNATACWGYAGASQLGLGDTLDRQVPNGQVPLPATAPLALSAGTGGACELRGDHTVWCWGQNDHAQLDGAAGAGPAKAPLAMPAVLLATSDHSCAIQMDNSLACWGPNDVGQVGNGGTSAIATNAMVTGGGAWIAVASGVQFTCGIKDNKHLYCWGNDKDGEVPDKNPGTPKLNPVDVGNSFVSVSAGYTHACAVKLGNTLQCWGYNGTGAVGTGAAGPSVDMPTVVGSALWTQVSAGNNATCGVQVDGSLWCWGENNVGQLGIGSFMDRPSPTRVGTDTGWTSVSMGASHACATKGDALYCWGLDDHGQLGLGSAWRDAWQAL